ncbi:histone-lysine N-methyltransferase SETMAR [Trichonephila clavipes]|nr:histone-lysine N-methyltransferase SETMAR [Trichonephila clavipes]
MAFDGSLPQINLGVQGENASLEAEIENGVYDVDTVTANYAQFWFRRFRSGIFHVKDAPHTGRPVIQKEARCLGATSINTKKHDESNFHLRSIGKQKKIDPFLKRMVPGEEKWVTYDNIVRKRSWSKRGEAAQTLAKPELTARKGSTVYLVGLEKNHLLSVASLWPNTKFRSLLSTTGPFEGSD